MSRPKKLHGSSKLATRLKSINNGEHSWWKREPLVDVFFIERLFSCMVTDRYTYICISIAIYIVSVLAMLSGQLTLNSIAGHYWKIISRIVNYFQQAQVHKPIKITPLMFWCDSRKSQQALLAPNRISKWGDKRLLHKNSNSSMMFDMLWFWYDFQQFPTNSTDSQFLSYICYDLRIFEAYEIHFLKLTVRPSEDGLPQKEN